MSIVTLNVLLRSSLAGFKHESWVRARIDLPAPNHHPWKIESMFVSYRGFGQLSIGPLHAHLKPAATAKPRDSPFAPNIRQGGQEVEGLSVTLESRTKPDMRRPSVDGFGGVERPTPKLVSILFVNGTADGSGRLAHLLLPFFFSYCSGNSATQASSWAVILATTSGCSSATFRLSEGSSERS